MGSLNETTQISAVIDNPLDLGLDSGSVNEAVRLKLANISLNYDVSGSSGAALSNVNLEVADKEFAVIVGPSGCGKSSLLYIAAGLIDSFKGTVRVDDQPVEEPGADRGMVFQSYTLFPWLTVSQNIEFGLKRRGIKATRRQQIVDHYLAEVELSAFRDHYPSQLSGGMKQRVAIARAMANEPAILLMDEPFGALDSQTRASMQRLLLRVWEHTKNTVLFVTHDIDEAVLLADRIYVMTPRPGRIRDEVIPVSLPRPRDMAMTMEPEFIALKRRVLHLLHGEDEPQAVD